MRQGLGLLGFSLRFPRLSAGFLLIEFLLPPFLSRRCGLAFFCCGIRLQLLDFLGRFPGKLMTTVTIWTAVWRPNLGFPCLEPGPAARALITDAIPSPAQQRLPDGKFPDKPQEEQRLLPGPAW